MSSRKGRAIARLFAFLGMKNLCPEVTIFSVRTANHSDIPAVDALFSRSYPILLKPHYPPSVLVTCLPLISRAQPRLVTSGTFYVGLLDGEIVAAGGWTHHAPQSGKQTQRAHIRHVVTNHRRTGRGFGRALITHSLEQAKSAGIRHMECQSTLAAVGFYRALGFDEIGPLEIELRPGIMFPAAQMIRKI